VLRGNSSYPLHHSPSAIREHGKALRKLGLSAGLFPGADFFPSTLHVETY
jgi:hypothetical protein